MSLNISLIDDDILENNENFYLIILGYLYGGAVTGSNNQAIVNILNDDG